MGSGDSDINFLGRHYAVDHINYIKFCTVSIKDTFPKWIQVQVLQATFFLQMVYWNSVLML